MTSASTLFPSLRKILTSLDHQIPLSRLVSRPLYDPSVLCIAICLYQVAALLQGISFSLVFPGANLSITPISLMSTLISQKREKILLIFVTYAQNVTRRLQRDEIESTKHSPSHPANKEHSNPWYIIYGHFIDYMDIILSFRGFLHALSVTLSLVWHETKHGHLRICMGNHFHDDMLISLPLGLLRETIDFDWNTFLRSIKDVGHE